MFEKAKKKYEKKWNINQNIIYQISLKFFVSWLFSGICAAIWIEHRSYICAIMWGYLLRRNIVIIVEYIRNIAIADVFAMEKCYQRGVVLMECFVR